MYLAHRKNPKGLQGHSVKPTSTLVNTLLKEARRPCECSMKSRKSRPRDKNWRAAEAALTAAQQMPAGPARFAALKEAGQLRLKADEGRLRKEQRDRDKTP
jgi:hypothetical protein